jgi:hypothetical protein
MKPRTEDETRVCLGRTLSGVHGVSASLGALVAIANGEARPIEQVWPDGSYTCPWCFYGVQADAAGCGNPACFALVGSTYWTAERIEARRAELKARADEEARRQRDHEAALERIAAERQDRIDKWAVVAAEAEKRAACLSCLRASAWETFGSPWYDKPEGRAKFVRHRGQCPRGR